VLRIDTLLVGNRCARRSATQALLTVLTVVFPDFARNNRDRPNLTRLRWAPAARSYVDNEGPDIVGVYVPWVVDLMPTAGWVQLIFGGSILLNAMSLWHRFRLWRIDTHRVQAEGVIALLFGPGGTVGEIAEMPTNEQHRTPGGARHAGRHHGPAHDAVGPVPSAVAVGARANGPGILLPLPGSAYR